jgi:hypothetical protein
MNDQKDEKNLGVSEQIIKILSFERRGFDKT